MMDLKRMLAAGVGLVMVTGAAAGVVAAASPDEEPVSGSAEPAVVTDDVVETIPTSQTDASAYGGEEGEEYEEGAEYEEDEEYGEADHGDHEEGEDEEHD